MIKKLILITGLMLSANLWADSYKYKLCSSWDDNQNPKNDDWNLERCVTKYLNLDYQLYGDPFVNSVGTTYQALLGHN